jgi:hypothetical protein
MRTLSSMVVVLVVLAGSAVGHPVHLEHVLIRDHEVMRATEAPGPQARFPGIRLQFQFPVRMSR